ncbi:MAG: endonuclease/exonuclease/phosphatase family protein [Alphaproteobacteria bacterium]|nr:endonuclease/exonuclease/phosphatase family protein [Alphaproteobacteria bacterium]
MKIVSWNLLHRNGASLDEIAALVRHEAPDLLLMQEAADHIDGLVHRVGGYYARSPLPGRTHGLAAWGPRPLATPPTAVHLPRGMLVKRICQIVDLGRFAVANVHLSHGQLLNRRQLRSVAQALPARAAVLGDCNMIGPPMLPGFRDAGPRRPTHAMARVMPLRLDRCLVRGLTCEGSQVLANGGSDHRPIVVLLSVPPDGP